MSTAALPTPTEISERLVRCPPHVVLADVGGIQIAARRNGYTRGFGLVILARDNHLGILAKCARIGFKRLPSAKALARAVQNARNYVRRNTEDAPGHLKLRPYVEPSRWQHLSLDRLTTPPPASTP